MLVLLNFITILPTVSGNSISVYFNRAVIDLAALFIYLTNIKLSGIIVITSLQGACLNHIFCTLANVYYIIIIGTNLALSPFPLLPLSPPLLPLTLSYNSPYNPPQTLSLIAMKIINNTIKDTKNNNINETNMAYKFNIVKRIRNIKYEEIKKLINKTNNYGTNG